MKTKPPKNTTSDKDLKEILKRMKLLDLKEYQENHLHFIELATIAYKGLTEDLMEVQKSLGKKLGKITRKNLIAEIANKHAHKVSPELEQYILETCLAETSTSEDRIRERIEAITSSLNRFDASIELGISSSKNEKYLETAASKLYQIVRSSITDGRDFSTDDNKWPTAQLKDPSNKPIAIAQLNPEPKKLDYQYNNHELENLYEKMAKYVLEMGDETVDVFDMISAKWIKEAKHIDQMITINADDFLNIRGLKTQKSSSTGRRGGYKDEWRKEFKKQIDILSCIWIRIHEMDVIEEIQTKSGSKRAKVKKKGLESHAILVDSRFGDIDEKGQLEPYAYRVRPGTIFTRYLLGPGRQTALLSQKALEYDPYRRKWEKRLTRYLSWQWRIKQSKGHYLEPYKVSSLLEHIREDIDYRNPSRTRERLESALDTLLNDGIITSWQYSSYDEFAISEKGWVKKWLEWKLIIEPPQPIMDQYAKIKMAQPKSVSINRKNMAPVDIKKVREERRLTITKAAEQIGISPSQLSRIERGCNSSKATHAKINQWAEENQLSI